MSLHLQHTLGLKILSMYLKNKLIIILNNVIILTKSESKSKSFSRVKIRKVLSGILTLIFICTSLVARFFQLITNHHCDTFNENN